MADLLNYYLPNDATGELLCTHSFYPYQSNISNYYFACKTSIDKKTAMICCSDDAGGKVCNYLIVDIHLQRCLFKSWIGVCTTL